MIRDRYTSPDELLHRQLASSHTQRRAPKVESFDFEGEFENEMLMRRIERELVEAERAAVAPTVHVHSVRTAQARSGLNGVSVVLRGARAQLTMTSM
jgi:hypothetical protein